MIRLAFALKRSAYRSRWAARTVCSPQNRGYAMKHSIVVTHFKRLCRGSLIGFANIFIAELHLSVRDVAIHRSAGGNCWAQLPANR